MTASREREEWRTDFEFDRRYHNGQWGVYGPKHPVDGGNYAALARFSDSEHAALVVRAVNAHAELVSALEAVLAQTNPETGTVGLGVYLRARALLARVRQQGE